MPFEEPSWWYGPGARLPARLLAPVAGIVGAIAARRMRRPPDHRSRLTVICVGNLVAGGTGKTPLAIEIVRRLLARGERPAVLSRGYGGRDRGPHLVVPGRDTAALVGDEALLIASHAPVMICRDRALGARAIEAAVEGFSAIVMDDGLQNPTLARDLVLAVVDARRGIGNGAVIPAGPLRAPLEDQLALVDAIVINDSPAAADDAGEASTLNHFRREFKGPVLRARPVPIPPEPWPPGASVVAFAGIANPVRFFASLEAVGAQIVAREAFADHHPFSEADCARLLALAAAHDADLVTTEKDWMRLSGLDGAHARLRGACRVLAIRTQLDERDTQRLDELIAGALARTRRP